MRCLVAHPAFPPNTLPELIVDLIAAEERDIIPGGDWPEDFGRFTAAEVTKWRSLAARIGLLPQ